MIIVNNITLKYDKLKKSNMKAKQAVEIVHFATSKISLPNTS